MKTTNYYDVYEKYIVNNEPIPYKDILIYPILWKDAYDFLDNVDIITIDKDATNDVNIISVSYLNFIVALVGVSVKSGDKVWYDKFSKIFKLCLNIDIGSKDFIIGTDEYDRIYLKYDNKTITEKDFDKIRKIILYQNLRNYDDVYIDPEVRKSIEQYYAIKNKDIEMPTLERTKLVLMSSGFSSKEIQEMTYREVEGLKEMLNDKIEYATNKIIMHIPYVDYKKMELDHWIYKKQKDKYGDAFVELDSIKQKFAQGKFA